MKIYILTSSLIHAISAVHFRLQNNFLGKIVRFLKISIKSFINIFKAFSAYIYRTNLQRHIKNVHHVLEKPPETTESQEKPITQNSKRFICELCGKVMKSRYAWNCHMQRHTGRRNYRCTLCDSRFFEGSNLRQHMKKSHKIEKFSITSENKVQDES